MIKSIEVDKFKAFGSNQVIPIKPITLIFGPNSAGKSSILHSLLYLHEVAKSDNFNVFYPAISGQSIDLGGYSQFVHKHDYKSPISFSISTSNEKWNAADKRMEKYLPTYPSETIIKQTFTIGYSQASESKKILLLNYVQQIDDKEVFTTYSINDTKHKIGTIDQEFFFSELKSDEKLVKQVVSAITFNFQGIKLFEGITEVDSPNTDEVQSIVDSINVNLLGIDETNEELFNTLTYLGPLRTNPNRNLVINEESDPNWRAGGGHAWSLIKSDKGIRDKVNKWLSADWMQSKYELTISHKIDQVNLANILPASMLSSFRELMVAFFKNTVEGGNPSGDSASVIVEEAFLDSEKNDVDDVVVNDLISRFVDLDKEGEKLIKSLFSNNRYLTEELVLRDLKNNTDMSHRDVGIGLSQVIPVLVESVGNAHKTILIEQPEIHLHPAMQKELADVFIESALGENKNTFIIETHSEHLILRILRRIRENSAGNLKSGSLPITPNDVQVLYVEPKPEGNIVHQLKITTDGDFEDHWPQGFFNERVEELF